MIRNFFFFLLRQELSTRGVGLGRKKGEEKSEEKKKGQVGDQKSL
jgi:hypothetical protein